MSAKTKRIPVRNGLCKLQDEPGEMCIDEDGSGRFEDERCPDCPLGPGTIPYRDDEPPTNN